MDYPAWRSRLRKTVIEQAKMPVLLLRRGDHAYVVDADTDIPDGSKRWRLTPRSRRPWHRTPLDTLLVQQVIGDSSCPR